MNLTIDIGNNYTKVGIFSMSELSHSTSISEFNESELNKIIHSFPSIEKVIFSSVNSKNISFVEKYLKKIIYLNSSTPIPILNTYKTPETLGMDRIAAVVGANHIFKQSNILIIDAGTAITYDFINSQSEYLGGNISPGIDIRFKSLNHYTNKLPLENSDSNFNILGHSTKSAIIAGVQQGIVFEIEGYINLLSQYYIDLKVILTGGNSFFFEKILKKHIFVNQNLVLIGLNKILEYNV